MLCFYLAFNNLYEDCFLDILHPRVLIIIKRLALLKNFQLPNSFYNLIFYLSVNGKKTTSVHFLYDLFGFPSTWSEFNSSKRYSKNLLIRISVIVKYQLNWFAVNLLTDDFLYSTYWVLLNSTKLFLIGKGTKILRFYQFKNYIYLLHFQYLSFLFVSIS